MNGGEGKKQQKKKTKTQARVALDKEVRTT